MIDKYDDTEIYCKKLGHELTFNYCRCEHDGLPCQAIFDCWYQRLPIGEFMKENYKSNEIPYFSEPKPDKVFTIMELIAQAKGRK